MAVISRKQALIFAAIYISYAISLIVKSVAVPSKADVPTVGIDVRFANVTPVSQAQFLVLDA